MHTGPFAERGGTRPRLDFVFTPPHQVRDADSLDVTPDDLVFSQLFFHAHGYADYAAFAGELPYGLTPDMPVAAVKAILDDLTPAAHLKSNAAFLFDPAAQRFRTLPPTAGRLTLHGRGAGVLPDGRAVFAENSGDTYCVLFDPAASRWQAGTALGAAHNYAGATVLPDGRWPGQVAVPDAGTRAERPRPVGPMRVLGRCAARQRPDRAARHAMSRAGVGRTRGLLADPAAWFDPPRITRRRRVSTGEPRLGRVEPAGAVVDQLNRVRVAAGSAGCRQTDRQRAAERVLIVLGVVAPHPSREGSAARAASGLHLPVDGASGPRRLERTHRGAAGSR
ncbi:hypothetical protein OHA72_48860 [Dactylosporangium sp. NBC_01737]|uniref:hypothetical protein n=1 Tax=Dactylosporangium sp. NBC_01737 TaxID=2975959 RepID=UPI002E15D83D|nr:hypothetical protein OHA72_48860 [Dactylosporangium sp. NBC_01737]